MASAARACIAAPQRSGANRMKAETQPIPLLATVYISVVVAGGMWAIIRATAVWQSDDILRFICYLALAVAVSVLKVNIPAFKGTMSVNFLFILIGVSEMSRG